MGLRTVAGEPYQWKGGVGAERSVVAYSAICAHRLAYPTCDITFISYRLEKSASNRIRNVIHCCAEHSQYDPAEGARVLAGPAPQPLAAILLEHDSTTDELHAVGTLGGEMFGEFLDKYSFRLSLEHRAVARARFRSVRCPGPGGLFATTDEVLDIHRRPQAGSRSRTGHDSGAGSARRRRRASR